MCDIHISYIYIYMYVCIYSIICTLIVSYRMDATLKETYWLDVAQDVNTTLAHIDWLQSSGWISDETTEARPQQSLGF